MSNFLSELKTLNIKVRNKVRGIIHSDISDSIKVMNSLRKKLNGRELCKVENVISSSSLSAGMLPKLFPDSPQVTDSYNRLCNIPLKKKLDKIDFMIGVNLIKLECFFEKLEQLNSLIIKRNIKDADFLLKKIIEEFGYSNLILRKSIFLHMLEEDTPESTKYVHLCGIRKSLVNSLLYCYEEDQDYLSVKKTAISVDKERNVFIRDMLRVSFLPIESDPSKLSSLLQSCLQSSLIDAVILLKINFSFHSFLNHKNICTSLNFIKGDRPFFINLLGFYRDFKGPESVFFNRSSAWLEFDDIISYRIVMDHFFDDNESDYLKISEDVFDEIDRLILIDKPENLLNGSSMLNICKDLNVIADNGFLTRSAIYNFMMTKNKGRFEVSINTFKSLMEKTVSLSRILDVENLKSTALLSESIFVEIIAYLLIIRRYEDDYDNFYLSELVQQEIIHNYNGDVVSFVKGFSEGSIEIGNYIYDIFNEEFLSILSDVVKSSEEITNIRARLHHWMGDITNDNSYYERANNLIVDHRINLVRDELDDHRIYVDTSKFIQWMQDDVSKELTTVLVLFSSDQVVDGESQLKELISKCFNKFYSDNVFGVSSYLGRRLRHGTFKGFVYSDTVNEIVKKYGKNIDTDDFKQKWDGFKFLFEKEIDKVVNDNLHIKSKSKRNGFLDPNIYNFQKESIVNLAVKNLSEDFVANGSTYSAMILINEYCWRLAEVDMKHSAQKLKNIRSNILSYDFFLQNKRKQSEEMWKLNLFKDLHNIINEKFKTVYGWFNKPHSVSPKASLGLLYKAVVAEVRDSYPDFQAITDFYEEEDIEMNGGAYHNIYDALYVIIYNAAKHGKKSGDVNRSISLINNKDERFISISISSQLKDEDEESDVRKRLELNERDIDLAQVIENRSGIAKLYNLEKFDSKFSVDDISCKNRNVVFQLSYKLG
ncbi:hypothetical protein [Marinomonas shanghaiensis]|uniref:hypothetical protein n=1 Tax=Marinomonas shanghaiensis TaxID=2202418 RepID=UPI003A91FE12